MILIWRRCFWTILIGVNSKLKTKTSPKFIIVLGTFYSGAGAVYDFLAGRSDSKDPLNGKEYLLPQIPYGIMALHATCESHFSHPSANINLTNFKKVAYKLGQLHTKSSPGMGYAEDIRDYYLFVDSYTDSITVSTLPYESHWDWFTASLIKRVYQRLKKMFINKVNPKKKYLPVNGDEFLKVTREFHTRMFSNHEKKYTLLNQAGSGWNPVNSTEYFPRRKVILVVRDPRDQYCELIKHKNAGSVNEYVKWYKEMRQRIALIDSKYIKVVRFEEFVFEYSTVSGDVCEFLNIDKDLSSNYDPIASRKNIGIYKELLGKEELEIITINLQEYFYN